MNKTISNQYFIGSQPVVINPGYGGFTLDPYLLDQFNNIFGEDKYNPYNPENFVRTHPKVILLFEELFNQSNSKSYGGLTFIYIPEKYVIHNAFTISEYDGAENVELNTHKLAVEMIREITNDRTKSESLKMSEISTILATII